jgi:prepilin-type N-terminal cleavage/methylation domain-containing protein
MLNNKGFTLLEMIVTMLLFGILAAIIYGSFTSALKFHKRITSMSDLNLSIYKLNLQLENDIKHMNLANAKFHAIDSAQISFNTVNVKRDRIGNKYLNLVNLEYFPHTGKDTIPSLLRISDHYNYSDTIRYAFPKGYFPKLVFVDSITNVSLESDIENDSGTSLKLKIYKNADNLTQSQLVYERIYKQE